MYMTTANYTVTVRLAGGRNLRQGRLEVLYRGIWGTVCDDDFDHRDAMVACYMLGFGYVCFCCYVHKTYFDQSYTSLVPSLHNLGKILWFL